MGTLKNPKTIAIATTVLCVASLFWLMSTLRVNNSLETHLEQEKLHSETLLSEKLLLEKDLDKIRGQLSSLKGINSELDHIVKSSEEKVAMQEVELNRMKKQNASLAQIKKQREELVRLKANLENELTALRTSYAALENQNQILSTAIAVLQEKNNLLTEDLNRAMFASLDHSQVQAVKGKKEKLTVRASRTNKLMANFEVPASLKNISFRVMDQKGNVLSGKQGNIVSRIKPSDQNMVASSSGDAGNGMQRVEMEYIPKGKMQSGLYTVEILNDNLYVGSLNVKLR